MKRYYKTVKIVQVLSLITILCTFFNNDQFHLYYFMNNEKFIR